MTVQSHLPTHRHSTRQAITDKRKVKQEGKKDAKKRSAQVEDENEAKRICLQLDEDDNDSVDGLLMDMMEDDCDDTN